MRFERYKMFDDSFIKEEVLKIPYFVWIWYSSW